MMTMEDCCADFYCNNIRFCKSNNSEDDPIMLEQPSYIDEVIKV